MESLNDILKRIGAMSSSSGISSDRERAEPASEQLPCPVCDDARWLNVDAPIGSPEFGTVVPCECQERVWGAHTRNRLRDYSDLGPLERMTFESMDPTGREGFVDPPTFRRARDASQTYSHDPMGWLIITGPSGTGKTHLAAAIANRLIADGKPAKFVSVPDLLDHMRATLERSGNDPEADNFEGLFNHIIEAPMLVLDDLGVQSPTRWAEEKIDQVLSHRYARRLPTVITTSLTIEQMPDRLRTRVTDPFISQRIELQAGVGNADRSAIGIDSTQLKAKTFETFEARGARGTSRRQQQTLEAARSAARSFAEIPQGWIYLAGPTGVGKTHLAVAVANVQVQQGRTVLFRFVPDLLDQLRRAYHPNSATGFDREFQVIRNCEVLILDDLGAQASTAWAEEKLYQLIVHRHAAGLPTVITSRILLDEAAASGFTSRYADAIASRLRDTHVVWEYAMLAPDYRHRGAARSGGAGGGTGKSTEEPRQEASGQDQTRQTAKRSASGSE